MLGASTSIGEGPSASNRRVRDLLLVLFAVGTLATLAASVQILRVEGRSMEDTLRDGDVLLVVRTDGLLNRLRGALLTPGRIVVFTDPLGEAQSPMVKRIAAIGGSRVEITRGTVIVDGRPQESPPTIKAGLQSWGWFDASGKGVLVQEGHYFVLSDNRGFVSDSRAFGSVPDLRILGIVVAAW